MDGDHGEAEQQMLGPGGAALQDDGRFHASDNDICLIDSALAERAIGGTGDLDGAERTPTRS